MRANDELVQEQQNEREADAALLANVNEGRAVLRQPTVKMEEFRATVVACGINNLDTNDTHELLLLLGVTSATLALLRREKVDGSVLIDLSEEDMLAVFNILRVGDRRRLTMAPRRLTNHQGFPETLQGQPGALSWDCKAVGQWLTNEGFERLVPKFAEHTIDGAVLLTLDQRDLTVLGVATLVRRARSNEHSPC